MDNSILHLLKIIRCRLIQSIELREFRNEGLQTITKSMVESYPEMAG
jgi:hypothetical protein